MLNFQGGKMKKLIIVAMMIGLIIPVWSEEPKNSDKISVLNQININQHKKENVPQVNPKVESTSEQIKKDISSISKSNLKTWKVMIEKGKNRSNNISKKEISRVERIYRNVFSDSLSLPYETAYDKLRFLFKNAKAPSKKDIKGWFAGRMFFDTDQNTPFGALLIGKKGELIPDGGPLFSRDLLLYFVISFKFDVTYYDTLTEEKIKEIEKALKEPRPSAPKFTDSGVIFYYPGGLSVEVRKLNNYLFARIKYEDEEVNVERTHFAYFFKNITPNQKHNHTKK